MFELQIARNEHYNRTITKAVGSAQRGVWVISAIILTGGMIRNALYVLVNENCISNPHPQSSRCRFDMAVDDQDKIDALEQFEYGTELGYLVLGVGMLLVLSSFVALGWNGTFLGLDPFE